MKEGDIAIAHCSSPVADIQFLGQSLANVNIVSAGAIIAARPPEAPFAYIVTPNAQHFVLLDRERKALTYSAPKSLGPFADAYAHAWLRLCDSQIVRLLARIFHGISLPLAPGSDLTEWLFTNVITPDDAITVIGGNAELEERLRTRFHLAKLALYVPPMGYIDKPSEVDACVDFLRKHPARFVFLATGAPQSELLARRLSLEPGITGIGLCIGGSLLFLTGITTRAPLIYRRFGLEWLHRLLSNPRRYARRVFIDSMPIIPMVIRDALFGCRGSSPGEKPHDSGGKDAL